MSVPSMHIMELPWLFLILAIGLDITGTIALKLSEGCTQLWPSVVMVSCYLLSLAALAGAINTIELSLAYALWTGIGTALTVLVGIWWFKEPVTALKVISIALIILGITGLSLCQK